MTTAENIPNEQPP